MFLFFFFCGQLFEREKVFRRLLHVRTYGFDWHIFCTAILWKVYITNSIFTIVLKSRKTTTTKSRVEKWRNVTKHVHFFTHGKKITILPIQPLSSVKNTSDSIKLYGPDLRAKFWQRFYRPTLAHFLSIFGVLTWRYLFFLFIRRS